MDPAHNYSQNKVVSACLIFSLVAPFFHLEKVQFLAFLNVEKCVAI